MSARFWMICRAPRHPHSKTEPTRRYDDEAEARRDAQTMADQHNVAFVALSATDTIHPKGDQKRLL